MNEDKFTDLIVKIILLAVAIMFLSISGAVSYKLFTWIIGM